MNSAFCALCKSQREIKYSVFFTNRTLLIVNGVMNFFLRHQLQSICRPLTSQSAPAVFQPSPGLLQLWWSRGRRLRGSSQTSAVNTERGSLSGLRRWASQQTMKCIMGTLPGCGMRILCLKETGRRRKRDSEGVEECRKRRQWDMGRFW